MLVEKFKKQNRINSLLITTLKSSSSGWAEHFSSRSLNIWLSSVLSSDLTPPWTFGFADQGVFQEIDLITSDDVITLRKGILLRKTVHLWRSRLICFCWLYAKTNRSTPFCDHRVSPQDEKREASNWKSQILAVNRTYSVNGCDFRLVEQYDE